MYPSKNKPQKPIVDLKRFMKKKNTRNCHRWKENNGLRWRRPSRREQREIGAKTVRYCERRRWRESDRKGRRRRLKVRGEGGEGVERERLRRENWELRVWERKGGRWLAARQGRAWVRFRVRWIYTISKLRRFWVRSKWAQKIVNV